MTSHAGAGSQAGRQGQAASWEPRSKPLADAVPLAQPPQRALQRGAAVGGAAPGVGGVAAVAAVAAGAVVVVVPRHARAHVLE